MSTFSLRRESLLSKAFSLAAIIALVFGSVSSLLFAAQAYADEVPATTTIESSETEATVPDDSGTVMNDPSPDASESDPGNTHSGDEATSTPSADENVMPPADFPTIATSTDDFSTTTPPSQDSGTTTPPTGGTGTTTLEGTGRFMMTSLMSATETASTSLPTVRVNAGGSSYTDTLGHTWSADSGYNTGKVFTSPATTTVSGTTDPALFRTERYDDTPSPELSYVFNVPNGSYVARLYIAETYPKTSGAGLRVFDVNVQGATTWSNVDVYSQAGGAGKLLKLETPVSVSDGKISIQFIHRVQNPKVNAIEIVPASEASSPSIVTVSGGGGNENGTGTTTPPVGGDTSTSTPPTGDTGTTTPPTGGTGTTTPSAGETSTTTPQGGNPGTSTSTLSISSVSANPNSGMRFQGDHLLVYFQESNHANDVTLGACTVNGVAISAIENLNGGTYRIDYLIGNADHERSAGTVPINCTLENSAGDSVTITAFTDGNSVAIDTNHDGTISGGTGGNQGNTGSTTPMLAWKSITPNSGVLHEGDHAQVYFQEFHNLSDLVISGLCTINGANAGSLDNLGNGLYRLNYVVGPHDPDRTAGTIPVHCVLSDIGGSVDLTVLDPNTLAIDVNGNGSFSDTNVDNGTLAVSGIAQEKASAVAGAGFDEGWVWTFSVTVPSNETTLRMKFGDWAGSDGTSTMPMSGNMRISSGQASSTDTVVLSTAGVYSDPLVITGDLDPNTPGKQIAIKVEVKIPADAKSGSYGTYYGIQTTP